MAHAKNSMKSKCVQSVGQTVTRFADAKIVEAVLPLIRAHRAIHEKKALLIKQLQESKTLVGDYFIIDSKSQTPTTALAQRELSTYDAELRAAKSLVFMALGKHVLHIDLFQIYNLACDGTGLASDSTSVDPSAVSEFASLKELFDEYRVYAVDYDFQFQNSGFVSAGSSKTTLCVTGYDPAELAQASGAVGVMQLQQHKLHPIPISTNTMGVIGVNTVLRHFSARVPDGVILSNNTGGPATTSTWQATSLPSGGTYIPYGYLKVNAQIFGLLNAPAISGMLTYRCGFRCRT